MWVFAPWGQRIPAQGKLVFERRPGIGCREFLLPCQGNGPCQDRLETHNLREIHVFSAENRLYFQDIV